MKYYKKNSIYLLFFLIFFSQLFLILRSESLAEEEPDQMNRVSQIPVPDGYKRVDQDPWGSYLLSLKLKRDGSPVLLYNGEKKRNQNVHYRIIDLDIGKRNLHQCADAIIHLRARYFYRRKEYGKIAFHFTSGDLISYRKYAEGIQPRIRGNRVTLVQKKSPGINSSSFLAYLDLMYAYAGTLSLSKETRKIPMKDLGRGDFLVQGGSPGHAVIVLDEAINGKTGKRMLLIAQSYMPAQEIHILKNPFEPSISPWYRAPEEERSFFTPEWNFPPGTGRRW